MFKKNRNLRGSLMPAIVLVVTSLVLLSSSGAEVGAQPSPPEKITIGSETYTKDQLIWDFLNIAFSDTFWLSNEALSPSGEPMPEAALEPFKSYVGQKETTPAMTKWRRRFLDDYTERPDGLPRQNSLMKWTGEISIGLDWPVYENPEIRAIHNTADEKQEVYERFTRQIEDFIPVIEDLTGLPVVFYPRRNFEELEEDKGRIRIAPMSSTNLVNYFKTHKFHTPTRPIPRSSLRRLVGAVPFTAETKSQVDGVIIPNADGTIGFAACEILETLPDLVLRAVVAECILRALGLPETAANTTHALLADWNAPLDLLSKRPFSDQSESVWYSPELRREEATFYDNFPSEFEQLAEPLQEFTAYDKFMIGLLYCSALEAGMDKYRAITALYENPDCFILTHKPHRRRP